MRLSYDMITLTIAVALPHTHICTGGLYLLLLHEGRSEDAVRGFFTETHELYVKHMLNPFAVYDAPISSPLFDARVRASARKFFAI
jgi:hypothetical protein